MAQINNLSKNYFSNKKILLVGLGILGGGLATALWFLKQKVKLTITDLKSKEYLQKSIQKLKKYNKQIKYVLGKHRFFDFKNNEIIIVNPAVKTLDNPYLNYAKKLKKTIENDLSFLFKFTTNPKICITGTRGKTTTTNWVYFFIKNKEKNALIGGNIPEYPIFSLIEKIKNNEPIILESSCFQLELFNNRPKIAVITSLYQDHLNRYKKMETYAKIKAQIFLNQLSEDYLVLNYNNKWTKFFLSLKPKSKIYFFSLKTPSKKNFQGIFVKNNKVYFRDKGEEVFILNIKNFKKQWGEHNVSNLLCAILVAYLYGLSFEEIKKQIPKLPQIKMRQEKIFENKKLKIINDSAGTSPEAAIAALERFKKEKKNLILICGGTDKNLNFDDLALKIKKYIKPENLVLLNGSATKNLLKNLEKIKYLANYNLFDNLSECLSYALNRASQLKKKTIILFSPASASFEKFKNEFDRGEKFNQLIKSFFKTP
ncbi:MAG: UDP-N-acetylmuramoyl-L-alanine--D-glutamate ligase [Minisyncoccia bacterium]